MIELIENTPLEKYTLKGKTIWVKREDLATPEPGPTFSKVRGLIPVLQRLKKTGIKHIAYTESAVSMAGWGVAWACAELGLHAIIFDPQFKKTPALLAYHRKQWDKFGATRIPIKAGRVKTGWYQSRKMLQDMYPEGNWELLPLGLVYPETVEAAADQMHKTEEYFLKKTGKTFRNIVIPTGSGTVAAGVIKAADSSAYIYCVLCRTGSRTGKLKTMMQKGGWTVNGLRHRKSVVVVDPGYGYTEAEEINVPWPCHPYYDAKAAKWMFDHLFNLDTPLLFWNIGS